jgi:hypothetical protein
MSTTSKSFFVNEPNAVAVRNFAARLRSLPQLAPPYPEVVQPLSIFFAIFSQHLTEFDEFCPANIDWLGLRYIDLLIAFVEQQQDEPEEQLIAIFIYSYRFLCELELMQPGDLSFELRDMGKFVDENLELFTAPDRQQLIYASLTMSAQVIKRLLHHPSLADFKTFSETTKSAHQLKVDWDKEIKAKKIETEGLRDAIEKLQTKFNFVGLVNGFENLLTKKKANLKNGFLSIILLGTLMALPVCIQLGFVVWNVTTIETHRATLIYSLPPLLALELILLYFFRVVLANHRGLQAQILQLDLRVSLCQFIQSYSEYSSKIKQLDASALDRFESIVFSAVTSGAEKMPTTFDGVEQLAKLVTSLRGK